MKQFVFLFSILFFAIAVQAQKHLNIVFIGNSITYGAGLKTPSVEAPPVRCAEWLRQQPTVREVAISNQGVSGATTVDFLPLSNSLFPKVIKAADTMYRSKGDLIFSVMLGTNDSAIKGPNGSPVSPVQYHTNMKVIIDELLARYPKCKVIVHRPTWYSPNTYNGAMYLKAGLDRLNSYFPQIQSMIANYGESHPQHVFLGDTDAYDYIEKHHLDEVGAEYGNAGIFYLHPNQKGAKALGEMWGKAIYRCLIH